ncbi:globin family protein [Falsiroseomonas stagni]|uniref:Hemoglobin-like flavoprotein n=1 Tax=Falsiroseomonas stagni DSM 19981 TaxID=1123062 RepID=A0A1I4AZX8_9PROT|nr:globin family protein [Falsiroseomonas stagni]SFK61391.1 Hemoglobin-like flavoprotein [Falsiroseomonas stagni DSM 19981]
MTPVQTAIVENSFRLVAPIAEPAAAIFYERLFALDPALKPLFARTDIRDQGRKLMQAIGFVVAHLRRPDTLLPAVAALGARHGAYGVQPAHYDTVGQALLETLAEGLGPHFTAEVRNAWAAAYGVLARTMIEATETPRAAA